MTNLSTPPHKRIKKYVPVIGLFQMQQSDKIIIEGPGPFSVLRTKHEKFLKNNNYTLGPIIKKRVLLGSETIPFDKSHDMKTSNSTLNKGTLGRFAIIGDSNCIDSTFTQKYCLWLLKAFLEYTMYSYKSPLLKQLNTISHYQNIKSGIFPERGLSSRLHKFSKVIKYKNN